MLNFISYTLAFAAILTVVVRGFVNQKYRLHYKTIRRIMLPFAVLLGVVLSHYLSVILQISTKFDTKTAQSYQSALAMICVALFLEPILNHFLDKEKVKRAERNCLNQAQTTITKADKED